MPFYSPLRYPGGKRKLANFIKLVLQENNHVISYYAEPYGGGAAIALTLLFEGYVSHIYINDISKSIYAFWSSVLYNTESFCDLIENTDVSFDEWKKQRNIQDEFESSDLLNLGFSTFFLNRTNRSGIIKGGIIGGKDQNGKYKLNARFNKENLIYRIKKIAKYKEQISIFNKDAASFLKEDTTSFNSSTFMFLDPPYFVKGKGLYENFYEYENHAEIAKLMTEISQSWIVTYDNVPEIRNLYSSYRHITYNLNYSAANRYHGKEIMFFSDDLKIPSVKITRPISNESIKVRNFHQRLFDFYIPSENGEM